MCYCYSSIHPVIPHRQTYGQRLPLPEEGRTEGRRRRKGVPPSLPLLSNLQPPSTHPKSLAGDTVHQQQPLISLLLLLQPQHLLLLLHQQTQCALQMARASVRPIFEQGEGGGVLVLLLRVQSATGVVSLACGFQSSLFSISPFFVAAPGAFEDSPPLLLLCIVLHTESVTDCCWPRSACCLSRVSLLGERRAHFLGRGEKQKWAVDALFSLRK